MTRARGFSLIEALIALAIFSFGLLGMAGLQANLINYSQNAQMRAEASFFAEQIIGFAVADPTNAGCYAFQETCANETASAAATAWRDQVTSSLPNADTLLPSVSFTTASGQFDVVIQWRHPSDETTRNYSVTTVVR
jgi:type IV pilus assembly protein PilV